MTIDFGEADRKAKYFTDTFLFSLIKTSLLEAAKFGNNTSFYIRIYWGLEMLYTFDEITNLFQRIKKYSVKRIDEAVKRALFYHQSALETIEHVLVNNLDKLGLDENVDINGQPFDF